MLYVFLNQTFIRGFLRNYIIFLLVMEKLEKVCYFILSESVIVEPYYNIIIVCLNLRDTKF